MNSVKYFIILNSIDKLIKAIRSDTKIGSEYFRAVELVFNKEKLHEFFGFRNVLPFSKIALGVELSHVIDV